MVFKLVLKHIFKAEIEEEKLKASVIYGWSLVTVAVISFFLIGIANNSTAELSALIFLVVIILFMTRYNSVKPLLGAASAGISVVAFTAVLESFFSRRNDSSATMGAIFGVIIVLGLMIIKNGILSLYYLSRETYRFYNYKMKSTSLEKTIKFRRQI
ncbi:hypothetical protein [Lysinibacillus fusiformis]|uniref:hypothetical protein n=1 Tax=Lysinibacillus fusiformis TaxID=28031 RepID=UPI00088C9368|nr:hypothetical protein [Lysinibacillus fusiformis]SCX63412.1 hypothetical protein SAMN02787108_03249 [Lysinibacillus fusiformis]SDB46221.1 hypothetical protein SAMN02787070_03444 [Lysinibacillus fusiformis]SFI72912.1 hypothetical protein SAMN02787080_03463 [Lysinibacillus fusiformis]SFT15680.1 hypothetical protein SAMN02787099_03164 [Lysinibacillus fusiformis]